MTRRPPSLLSPAQFEREIRELCKDALAIYPMYRRLHALGLEPRQGETVHVSGGENDPPASLAVDSAYAASRREYARWVVREIGEAIRRVDMVMRGLEKNVGPTPGFRQPEKPASDALGLSAAEFTLARMKQAERMKAGQE